MTLLRRQTPVEAAIDWRRLYLIQGVWTAIGSGSSKDVYDQLIKAKSSDEVDEIIGNKSWTHYACSGCRNDSPVVVMFGDEMKLCPECIQLAAKLLDQAT